MCFAPEETSQKAPGGGAGGAKEWKARGVTQTGQTRQLPSQICPQCWQTKRSPPQQGQVGCLRIQELLCVLAQGLT